MGLDDFPDVEPAVNCPCGESFAAGTQREIMGKAVDHLISEHELYRQLEDEDLSIPIGPEQARKNALISDTRIHPAHPDERNVQSEYELSTGDFLNTTYPRESKERYLQDLAKICGFEFEFGDWP